MKGVKITPKVLLHRVLDNADNFKSVIVIMLDKNDCADIGASNMSLKELAFLTLKLDGYTQLVLNGENLPPRAEIFPPDTPTPPPDNLA